MLINILISVHSDSFILRLLAQLLVDQIAGLLNVMINYMDDTMYSVKERQVYIIYRLRSGIFHVRFPFEL